MLGLIRSLRKKVIMRDIAYYEEMIQECKDSNYQGILREEYWLKLSRLRDKLRRLERR